MSVRTDRIITLARAELGYTEKRRDGHWTNEVKYTAGTAHAGQPWCLWFIVWVMRRARVPASDFPNLGSCGALLTWALAHGRKVSTPRRGDVVLINRKAGSSVPVHCGIVEHVHPSGVVTTIEGNTSATSSSEGWIVMERFRSPDRLVAVVTCRARPAPGDG